MYKSKFNETYNRIITETKSTKKYDNIENIISEGFIHDLLTGGLVTGGGLATILAASGHAACIAGNIASGLTIGFPLGAIAGSAVWLIHLLQDKKAKKEDESQINELIKKINNKTFNINDNEELEKLKSKYKNDINEIATTGAKNSKIDDISKIKNL